MNSRTFVSLVTRVGFVLLAVLLAACSDDGVTPDSDAPQITITAPTTDDSHLTNESTVTVSGTASDDREVARVEYEVSGGPSGTADGTTSWTIPGLSLSDGVNSLTVTAFDVAGNTASASLAIRLDQEDPQLSVTAPTDDGTFHTVSTLVDVSGTASDDHMLDRIEWSTDAGASGTIAASADWAVADLALELGDNTVTVTAYDVAGNSTEVTLVVSRFQNVGQASLDPGTVLTNSSEEIRVTIEIGADVAVGPSGVRLATVDSDNEVVEELAQLFDNGNLNNGDDILGDGVYSALVTISESEAQDLRLQIVVGVQGDAEETEARSEVSVLTVHEPTSTMDDQLQQDVQSGAASQLGDLLAGGSDLQSAVDQVAQSIAETEGVASVESEGVTSVAVTYDSGLKGGLFFNQTDAAGVVVTRGGGSTTSASAPVASGMRWDALSGVMADVPVADTLDRSPGTVPLSQQTVGTRPLLASSFYTAPPPENTILNRKVLIYAPYEAVWAPYNEGGDLVQMMNDSPLEYSITYLQNQAATVASLMNMTQYGLVILATHGSLGKAFATGEVATDAKRLEYDALRQDGQIGVWTNVEIDEDASGAAITEDVFVIYSEFISNLSGTFPQSLVVNNSCESTRNDDLWNAFAAKGVETYFGYDKVVSSSFAVDMVTQLIQPMVDTDLSTTGEAFTAGQTDPGSFNAEFQIRGSEDLRYSAEFINGDFEFGDLSGWTAEGDGRAIIRLASLLPTDADYMGIVSTGLGFTESSGSIQQSFLMPEDQTTLTFDWNYLSEEFVEFIDSAFQDFFTVSVIRADGTVDVLFHKTVDDIAADYGCVYDGTDETGGGSCELIKVSPEISFDVGGVWMTDWNSLQLDLSAYQGQHITLKIETGDVGDSIYDTAVLLDAITIN